MSKIKIKYKGVELDVTYDYTPNDKSTGFRESLDIEEIHHNGEEFTWLLEGEVESIEDHIWDLFKKHEL